MTCNVRFYGGEHILHRYVWEESEPILTWISTCDEVYLQIRFVNP